MNKQEFDALGAKEKAVATEAYIQGPQFVITFVDCPEDDLVKYHDSLGRSIRNQFGMWKDSWEPKIINGVDYSPHQPDQRSQAVIHAVWRELQ